MSQYFIILKDEHIVTGLRSGSNRIPLGSVGGCGTRHGGNSSRSVPRNVGRPADGGTKKPGEPPVGPSKKVDNVLDLE